MRTSRITMATATFAMVAAACGTADAPAEPPATTVPPQGTTIPAPPPSSVPFTVGELISLDLPRETGAVSPQDLAAVVAGDAAFGLDLFRLLAKDDNLMLSPYSIATALSMLYPGANGSTGDEIADVLHMAVDDATLHAARNAIETALGETPNAAPDDDREPFTIRPANSAWGQGGFPFKEPYLEVLARNYGAGLRVVDFVQDPDGSTDAINGWVEEATEDRIKDLLAPGVVNTDTRLVLVNAIWFKANWMNKFEMNATAPGEFTLLDGSNVTVPLMHGGDRGQYVATDRYEAVRLPYAGDAAMVIMLPTQGTTPAELAATLTPADLKPTFGVFQLDLTIPKFEFESELALREVLATLGMPTAFDPNAADLGGITDAANLFVQDALHKSFIAVDENGTEAAAATAVVVGLTSAPPPASFVADRPFLFWIEHSTTGEMLFLGQVTNPS